MSPVFASVRLFLLTWANRASWLRKRSLLGLAIVGSLAVGMGWALSHSTAERTVLVRTMPFFFAFAVMGIQVQYLALSALHAGLTGQSRSAWIRLVGVVLLMGVAYLLISYVGETFTLPGTHS